MIVMRTWNDPNTTQRFTYGMRSDTRTLIINFDWLVLFPMVAAILVLANIFWSWATGPIRKQVLDTSHSS